MSILFLIPPKTLSQTDLNTWNTIIKPTDVIFTSLSEDYAINDDYLSQLNCSVHIFNNFNSSGLIEKTAIELHQKYYFEKIISTSEVDVLRSAALRQYLNIPGQKLDGAILFRDKFKMKNLLLRHGIKTPKFKKINYATDLIKFIDEINYDIVVKPNLGAGSANTTILQNNQQLHKLLESNLFDNSYQSINFIAESFITGPMYHVDGIVLHGKILINQPSAYINTCVDFQNGVYLGSYMLPDTNPISARLQDLNKKVIEIMPCPNNFAFHAEYFHTNEDDLIFCEIACRPGGGAIKDVIFAKFGINIVTEWMKYETDPSHLFTYHPPLQQLLGFVLVPPFQGILKEIPYPKMFDWIKKYHITAKIDSQYSSNVRTSGEIINMMVCGDTEPEILERILIASSWVRNNIKWDTLNAKN